MRPDTGSFNRLLTSLGLVFLAAALVVPYFYFKNTSVLLIPSKRLEGLTPTARDALEGRQSGIAHLEVWVIVLAIALAIGGVFLVIAGAGRLKKAQESEEEEAELRKARARAEIQGLTPEEEDKKAAAEAEVESAEEDEDEDEDGGIGRGPEPGPSPEPPAPAEQQPPTELPAVADESPRIALAKEVILRIERRFKEAFRFADLGPFMFQPNLRIRSQVGLIEVDGLFTARSSERPDVVLELKVLRHPKSLRRNARNRVEQALATAARFGSIAREHAPVWLVMVIAMEAEAELSVDELTQAEERCQELMLDRGVATIVKEDEIDLLPERFLQLLDAGLFDAPFA